MNLFINKDVLEEAKKYLNDDEKLLSFLKEQNVSIINSIKAYYFLKEVPLDQAKLIVSRSSAWCHRLESDNKFHESLLKSFDVVEKEIVLPSSFKLSASTIKLMCESEKYSNAEILPNNPKISEEGINLVSEIFVGALTGYLQKTKALSPEVNDFSITQDEQFTQELTSYLEWSLNLKNSPQCLKAIYIELNSYLESKTLKSKLGTLEKITEIIFSPSHQIEHSIKRELAQVRVL